MSTPAAGPRSHRARRPPRPDGFSLYAHIVCATSTDVVTTGQTGDAIHGGSGPLLPLNSAASTDN